jgi:hypothetical protein
MMPAKKKQGRPPFKPTDEQRKYVSQMIAVGIPQEQVARAIVEGGIAVETLQKHFDEEIATASIKANAKIGGAAFNKAVGGDPQMIKWWTATRMGWKETQAHEHSGNVNFNTYMEPKPDGH